MVKAGTIKLFVLFLFIQSIAVCAESLFDIDESTYDVDDTNALVPVVRTKHQAVSHSEGSNIELIDVRCDAKSGMIVTVEFEAVFSGIIYSQGYYSDPKCRYVKSGGNDRVYTFTVPYEGCGSKASCSVCASVDNILVIQSDEGIQEVWDTARRITCSRSEVAEKTIYFKPFVVDMLEVVNVPTSTGGVECWMDIQVGSYPKIAPIPGPIKIGETLSVLVYLKDDRNEYDIIVRDCWAYDNEDYGAKTTGRLQLSDGNGCSRKKKLFGGWTKTAQTGNSGATSIVYNTLYAFKFPDKAQVFLKCDIEICRFGCDKPICDEKEVSKRPKLTTTTTTTSPRPRQTISSTLRSRVRVTTESTITDSPLSKTSTTRNIPIRTRPTRPIVVEDQKTEKATTQQVTTERTVRERITTPAQRFTGRTRGPAKTQPPVTVVSTLGPLRCFQGSDDPRCQRTETTAPEIQVTTSRTRQRTRPPVTRAEATVTRGRGRPTTEAPVYLPPDTTTEFSCENPINRNDPRCRAEIETTTIFSCEQNPDHPKCSRPQTTKVIETTQRQRTRGPTRPSTTRNTETVTQRTRPSRGRTTLPPTYLPPVTEFSCSNLENRNDPRCTTTSAPTTTREFETTEFVCRSGSNDPRCPPDCYPGNRDPRCPQPTTQRPTTTRRVETTTQFVCRPGSNDPRCPPDCYPGNRDPRCPQPTTQRPTTTRRVETTTQFVCRPGSNDPRCPPDCYPGNRDPRCPQTTTQRPTTTRRVETTTQFVCRPGSNNPRCPPDCYPGNRDPRCPQQTTPKPTFIPTTQPATYLPPNTTPRIETTTRFECRSGSNDPRCPPNCNLNPNDPRCPRPTTQRPTTTRRVETTTQFVCRPGSNDPRCPPDCYPGNRDPRCPQPTTQRPTTTRRVETTPQFVCRPGSNDPRCPRPFTTTQRPVTTTLSSCYPGSPDPRCPQPYRPSSTRLPSTYLPPFPVDASQQSVRQYRQIDPTVIEDINDLIQPGASDFHSIESSLSENQDQAENENNLYIRRKRAVTEEKEIISITLNFKGYQFA